MKFELSKKQVKKYYKWRKKLPKLDEGHFGAAGGGYWFKFVPTGVGVLVNAGRDDKKKHVIDLTDWENF